MIACSLCDKPARAFGLCSAHYTRQRRHGDPLGGGTSHGETERYFKEVVLAYDGDDCLRWPYAKTCGYGIVTIDGKKQRVTRAVCETVHGPAPTPDHDAAHSCGKGDEGCCTKRHLSWKTPRENMADKVGHGTLLRGSRHPNAKLTESDVREIIRLPDADRAELAQRFGVKPTTISQIHNGTRWAWLRDELNRSARNER